MQNKKSYVNKSVSEIYDAAIAAIPNAGFKVWKRRDIARLVMGVGSQNGQEVRCNIMVSMADGSATISVEADNLDESELKSAADKLTAELDKLLS